LITGRGDIVKPAPLWTRAFLVVVFPGFEVSTTWAYSNFRLTKKIRKYTISRHHKVELGELAPDRWQELLVNDLEPAVMMSHPEIGRCKKDLVRFGARASLMSGSGSTVFGLFEDRRTAEEASADLIAEGWHTALAVMPLFS
jgi:4-diphosphocytidyl-2-C-methyl-D-erythritol kinase